MKKNNFVIFALMVLALCFTSCDGGGSSSGEGAYVSFKGTNYSGKFQGGFSDTYDEPHASFKNGLTSCIGTNDTSNFVSSFNRSNVGTEDYFYIVFNNDRIGIYPPINCIVEIRYTSAYSATFRLTDQEVRITKYNNDVISGTFSGKDFNGKNVTGSFLFTNVGVDNWSCTPIPFSWPI